MQRAGVSSGQSSVRLGPDSLLKAYVRSAEDGRQVERALAEQLGAGIPTLILAADICRSELLVEIEVVHPA
jgi:hypothetical protein